MDRHDVDHMIRSFNAKPDENTYLNINNWYESNVGNNQDAEYLVCVYLFLVGANIKHRYHPMDRMQHRGYIKEVRDLIELADRYVRPQRKAYLDYGLKSVVY
jgi:hypothetical protein